MPSHVVCASKQGDRTENEMSYESMNRTQLLACKVQLEDELAHYKARDLKLNMARGKPSCLQLDLSVPMLTMLDTPESCFAEDGTDCRNYGNLEGIYEARRLMAVLLDDDPENVIVGGNSSLTLMYNSVARYIEFGARGSKPWGKYKSLKWICPVPGYDRHFAITKSFGFENIPVPMNDDGPDMDEVERIAASDDRVKGIWCVPKYSNPGGVTYSDEVVERLGHLKCAAHDFRIFWDNAYSVHHLYDDPSEQDHLTDIAAACRASGNPNRYVKFASTSKVTLSGAGIAAMASSPDNVAEFEERMSIATIGGDKINQLRHARFLKDADGIAAHMAKHAAILRPKFELVQRKLEENLAEVENCSWSKPRGGYFVSFNAPEGTAKHAIRLAKQVGVVMTDAGSTWPDGIDPYDSNIRIAPTLPPLEELEVALDVFCCCVKIAYISKLIENM